ncbi:5-formyltetrahydrofolate cyclo-ligase [Zoogloea sp.]|uniref:5-formyltetrahydrofolate cyclo-ligase n=1 Tax=Zoogloea sp. TaxID=49181 RepID=UPI00344C48C2
MLPPASPPETEIAALRKRLRQERLAAREALPAEQRQELTRHLEKNLDALLDHLAPRRLAFCWPWRAEADLVAWVSRWLAADPGRQAALPVVRQPGHTMEFLAWEPDAAMDTDHHGIPIPAKQVVIQPEVVLVPLNAFDAAGFRLGYGGGYFDRTLAALRPAPVCVGIAFELARAASTWPQTHDHPMDWIVTEGGAWAAQRD